MEIERHVTEISHPEKLLVSPHFFRLEYFHYDGNSMSVKGN